MYHRLAIFFLAVSANQKKEYRSMGKCRCIAAALCVTLAVLGVTGHQPAVAATGEDFLAGAAKKEIVPPFPTKMGGFSARTEEFTGVDFPIYARALVFQHGDTELVIIATDLVGVSWNLVEGARESIEEATGIPGDHILISATHSHSGPSGWQDMSHYGEDFDEDLYNFLVERFTEATVEARDGLRPAVLAHGAGHLDEITNNRQGNNDVIDPEVGVLKVQEPETREVIATLINFTGHPVILGSDNTLVSGEYPGYASKVVEEALGGVALFTQGACGEITMNRSGDPYKEVRRLGRAVAGEVLRTAETAEPEEISLLMSRFERIQVEPRDIPSVEEAERQLEEAEARVEEAREAGEPEAYIESLEEKANKAGNTVYVAMLQEHFDGEFLAAAADSSVHVMQVGPVVLVGIPGELFVEYGLEMKQRVRANKDRPMMLVGFANDYTGYLVTPRAWHTGGYEAGISRVAPESARMLTERAMTLVDKYAE